MTKAQALALVNALEANKVGCDAVLRFDAAGNETWNVQLDTNVTYSGAQLAQLTNYCAVNGLTLAATFTQLGVV